MCFYFPNLPHTSMQAIMRTCRQVKTNKCCYSCCLPVMLNSIRIHLMMEVYKEIYNSQGLTFPNLHLEANQWLFTT